MTGFVHPQYLVESDWLVDHLTEVVVLDCTVHLVSDSKTTYIIRPAQTGPRGFRKSPHSRCAVLRCAEGRLRHDGEIQFHAPHTEEFCRSDAPFRHKRRGRNHHLLPIKGLFT
jgi:hypothetical protein